MPMSAVARVVLFLEGRIISSRSMNHSLLHDVLDFCRDRKQWINKGCSFTDQKTIKK